MTNNSKFSNGALTIRLVVGIISIVLSCIITLQSCVAGLANTLSDNKEVSGTAGAMLGFFLLTSGIISIAARKTKGGIITAICFNSFGALIAFTNKGSYGDLAVWSVIALIFAGLQLLSLFLKNKSQMPQQPIYYQQPYQNIPPQPQQNYNPNFQQPQNYQQPNQYQQPNNQDQNNNFINQ